ncbi:hypothetical protein USB125703_01120 [Pseudoclavibacter triregionum]|nr:hypothetical protein USB125703_01120 [Pseudoclavibacter triregionum]
MAARLYLDVDGVVNAWPEELEIDELPGASGWPAFRMINLSVFGELIPITYAPELIRRLRALAGAGVEVVWLTTWRADVKHLARAIGLPGDWRALDFDDPRLGGRVLGDAKLPALLADLEKHPLDGPVAWADDELGGPDVGPSDASAPGVDSFGATLIAPREEVGLSLADVERLEAALLGSR